MIQEIGIVDSLQGEYAIIRMDKKVGCEHCAAKGSCSVIGGTEQVMIQAVNSISAKVGDTVKIEIPERSFLKASVLLYVVPIIALLIGGFIGAVFHPYFSTVSKDAVSATSALLFLIISIFVVKRIGKKMSKDLEYTPKVVQIIG